MDSNHLDSWVGTYTFSEFISPNINMAYNIDVFKEGNSYLANINIDGFQTLKRLKTKVTGNGNSIKFIFEKYMPENMYESYKKGDVLLSFQKKDSEIYTNWGEVNPMLPENNDFNVHFEKVADNFER